MQTSFRIAVQHDSECIADIYLASRKRYLPYAPLAHTDSAVRSWIRDQLIPSGNVTVILVDGAVRGFLAISRDTSFGWIDLLYLDPSAVGMGLGSLLLREAKSILGGPIRLYTFQQNQGARNFYHQHEFREIEFSDGALNEERIPDVLMEWP